MGAQDQPSTGQAQQGQPRRVRNARFCWAAVSFGAATAAIGVLVTVGWWTGSEWLQSIRRGWPALMPNTAAMCILGGAALGSLAWPEAPRWARAVGRGGAALTVALAGLTLAEYALGQSLGIDHLLLRTALLPVARLPGRPGLNTAAAFFLAGGGLLALDTGGERSAKAVQLMAAGAGSIATFAFLGYTFGIPQFYSVTALRPEIGMALHTAVALVLLSAGIIVARPHGGFMSIVMDERAGGVMARRLMPSLLAFLPVALVVLLGERRGWYDRPVVSALLVFSAMVESTIFILVTARRLSADDALRIAAEARLRESERRYRELFEHASDGLFISGLDGRYREVNQAGCALLGLREDEIIGRAIAEFIHPEDVPRLWQEREQLLRGGTAVGEWEIRRGDGSWLTVEVSATILADGRWQGFMRDISSRKRQESELAQAMETDRQLRGELERVTRAALTVSEAVVGPPRPDMSLVLSTIGLQAQMLTGARYVAIGIGTDPDKPFEPWIYLGVPDSVAHEIGRHPRPVGTLGEVARAGHTVRTADLSRHPAFRGLPPYHPDIRTMLGVPIRFGGQSLGNLYLAEKQGAEAFTEQDERMIKMLAARAAVAIQTAQLYAGEAQQRAWLRATIDQMPEGVILLDKDGHRAAINQAMLAFTRGSGGQLDPLGNPAIFDVRAVDGTPVPFEDLPVMRAFRRGEITISHEMLARVADGRMVPILVNAAPIRDDEGAIIGAAVVVQDITTIKELERSREEWASVVAHDLRQPVSAVRLTAQSLVKGRGTELPERERRAIQRIEASAERLNRMIDDLMDASLIEAKRLSLERRAVDLAVLIAAVAEGFRETLAGPGVDVATGRDEVAWIDPTRIHQVLGNLISNAAKYGRPDSPIRVETRVLDDFIEVSVTNRGAGIAPDELAEVFSRYARTRGARADRTPGLGLGLYIARGLVEAHGGRIWAESEPGVATSFRFTLPRAPRPADWGAPQELASGSA